MAISPRTLRIGSASLIALLLVSGAYLASGSNPLWGPNVADAESAEELLKEYAAKDSDGDSLPDWQEALYGTNPENPESFQAGITDGEAVAQGLIQPKVRVTEPEPTDPDSIPGITAAPSSLTDRFAQAILTQYLNNRGENPPTQEEILAFVRAGVEDLAEDARTAPRYDMSDVQSGQGGAQALREYAAAMEAAFAANTVPSSKDELSYFSDALKDDASALDQLENISGAYEDIAEAVIALPVPPEARQSHVAIANGLIWMSEINADLATLKSDPVRALLGISLYDERAQALGAGFSNLGSIFAASGIVLVEGEPGFEVYYIANLAKESGAQ